MSPYEEFITWVTKDLQADRLQLRRQYSGVFIWCLLIPVMAQALTVFARKANFPVIEKFSEPLFFLAPLLFGIWTFIRGARSFPSVFKRGGVVALLDQSLSEAEWARKKSVVLFENWKPTDEDIKDTRFSFDLFLERQRIQSRHFAVMGAVALFFVSFFLDYSTTAGTEFFDPTTNINSGTIVGWASDVSSWIFQVSGIVLIAILIHSIGVQSILTIEKYRLLLNFRPKR